MNQRDATYDNLKFVLMTLVVMGHCVAPYTKMSDLFRSAFCFIYFLHMPAFIFIAGLFSKKSIADKTRTKEKVFYFMTLFILLQIFIGCLSLLFLKDVSISFLTVDGLPWFMFVMACYYGLTYLLSKYNHRYVLFITVLLGCFSGYDYSIGDYLVLSRIIVYYPLFFLGYLTDPKKIRESLNKLYIRIIGIAAILFYAWLCVFHLEDVWKVKPLFSGRNSFEHLPNPAMGCIYRFVWYIMIILFISLMIAAIPKTKSIISTFGQRTLNVYFLHYVALYPLRTWKVFDNLPEYFPGGVWQLSFLVIGLLITIVFSLGVWNYPFDMITKMCKINK